MGGIRKQGFHLVENALAGDITKQVYMLGLQRIVNHTEPKVVHALIQLALRGIAFQRGIKIVRRVQLVAIFWSLGNTVSPYGSRILHNSFILRIAFLLPVDEGVLGRCYFNSHDKESLPTNSSH